MYDFALHKYVKNFIIYNIHIFFIVVLLQKKKTTTQTNKQIKPNKKKTEWHVINKMYEKQMDMFPQI